MFRSSTSRAGRFYSGVNSFTRKASAVAVGRCRRGAVMAPPWSGAGPQAVPSQQPTASKSGRRLLPAVGRRRSHSPGADDSSLAGSARQAATHGGVNGGRRQDCRAGCPFVGPVLRRRTTARRPWSCGFWLHRIFCDVPGSVSRCPASSGAAASGQSTGRSVFAGSACRRLTAASRSRLYI
jgi:hypothetical protein